jgi:hypothetical protein
MGHRGDGLDIDENGWRLHLSTVLAEATLWISINFLHRKPQPPVPLLILALPLH